MTISDFTVYVNIWTEWTSPFKFISFQFIFNQYYIFFSDCIYDNDWETSCTGFYCFKRILVLLFITFIDGMRWEMLLVDLIIRLSFNCHFIMYSSKSEIAEYIGHVSDDLEIWTSQVRFNSFEQCRHFNFSHLDSSKNYKIISCFLATSQQRGKHLLEQQYLHMFVFLLLDHL